MKKLITPLFLGLILLHSSFTRTDFREGFVVGGLTGLAAGLVSTALAHECARPEVVMVDPCIVHPVIPTVNATYCSGPVYKPRTISARRHTKVRRAPRLRRAHHQHGKALKQQEQRVAHSLRELHTLRQERKRLELTIKNMELKLKEAELLLKQAQQQTI